MSWALDHRSRSEDSPARPGAYPAAHCSTSVGWVRIAALVNCFRMSGSSGGMWICCAQNKVSGSGITLPRLGPGWDDLGVLRGGKGGESAWGRPPSPRFGTGTGGGAEVQQPGLGRVLGLGSGQELVFPGVRAACGSSYPLVFGLLGN